MPWLRRSAARDVHRGRRRGRRQAARRQAIRYHPLPCASPSPTALIPTTRSCSTASPAAPCHTGDLEVEQVLADIETLNRWAFEGRYEVTAVSFHAYAHLRDKYALLPHGASMGDGYGPMVVVREDGPTSLDGVTRRHSRHADVGVARAADVRARRGARRDAVRRDPGRRGRGHGRRRACSSTRASSPIGTTGCARSSTWASGGESAPAGCRCRWAATSSAATSGPT